MTFSLSLSSLNFRGFLLIHSSSQVGKMMFTSATSGQSQLDGEAHVQVTLLSIQIGEASERGDTATVAALCVRCEAALQTVTTVLPTSKLAASALFSVLSSETLGTSAREAALSCIALLVKHSATDLTRDVITMAPLLLIHGRVSLRASNPSTHADSVSTELKEITLRCLANALASRIKQALDAPQASLQLPLVAHAISAVLDALKDACSRNLKSLAQACLHALQLLVLNGLTAPDSARVLPGVVGTLASLFESKDGHGMNRMGSTVISSCLGLLDAILAQALTDGDALSAPTWLDAVENQRENTRMNILMPELRQFQADTSPRVPGPSDNVSMTAEPRKSAWHKQTMEKLSLVFSTLLVKHASTTRLHPNEKTRISCLDLCSHMLIQCSRAFSGQDCSRIMIDSIVSYTQDNSSVIRAKALEACSALRDRWMREGRLLQAFGDAVTRVTESFRSSHDEVRIADALRLCCGLIEVLGDDISTLLYAEEVARLLDTFLMHPEGEGNNGGILIFSKSNIKVLEDRDFIGSSHPVVLSSETEACDGQVLKRFESNQSEEVVWGISRVVHMLARNGNSVPVFNRLISSLDLDDPVAGKDTVVFLLNEFCRGSTNDDTLRSLIMSYLHSKVLSNPTSPRLGSQLRPILGNDNTIKMLNANIISTCLVLEGLGIAAQGLGADRFSPYLMDILYPVLERVGDVNRVVSRTAMHTLQSFASTCGVDVTQLLVDNVDYLINDLSLRMRYLQDNPDAPRMMRALLGVCGTAVLPFLDDAFEDILMAIDFHQGDMRLLSEVFGAVDSLVDVLRQSGDEGESAVPRDVSHAVAADTVSPEIREFEAWFRESQERSEKLDAVLEESMRSPGKPFEFSHSVETRTDEQIMEEENSKDAARESDAKPKLTPAQLMAQKVLTKAQHFIARNSGKEEDAFMQSLLLRLCAKSALILEKSPRTLNPIVHVLWPSVVNLLSSQHHFVIRDALVLVAAFARVSRDFIVKRFVTDLLPRLEVLFASFNGLKNLPGKKLRQCRVQDCGHSFGDIDGDFRRCPKDSNS
ncbi:armadillo-type protein [Chytriomyces sp. MP71]|nr:armadillo-type protein [Chytriomyces sp. MP71]